MTLNPTGDQLNLLERITQVIGDSHDFRETVDNIVAMVRDEMHTDVCSLYLYNEEKNTLGLVATKGLSPEAVGKVEMKPSEGLTGLVFETRTPLVVQDAQNHPRYRYFPVTKEEKYLTFLGVPLISRRSPIGVLVVQDREMRAYSTQEFQLFNTIAGQVASVVVNARLLRELAISGGRRPVTPEAPRRSTVIHGTPATPGIAMGKAVVMETSEDFHYIVEERTEDVEGERVRFSNALKDARREVEHLQSRVQEQLGEEDASIFNIHLMMLEDQGFTQKVEELIASGTTALYAIKSVVQSYLKIFSSMDDSYLRDRVVDIEDVGRRLIRLLSSPAVGGFIHLDEESILITRLITPSDAANLSTQKVKGVATTGGGHTSHAIILSRSMGIPCAVGMEDLMEVVRPGDMVVLDGNTGTLFVNPDESIVKEYQRLQEDYNRHVVELVGERTLPAVTLDGFKVELMANVGLLSDLALTNMYGADGIGLYRTELPFMARDILPTEDEQYRIYRNMVEGAKGKPVTIRTLDVGGDKNVPYLHLPKEENPFLGWRSIRMCLEKADVFKTQIRAILRAARHGSVNILLPMVATVEELLKAKTLIRETRLELESARIPHDPNVSLGIMIEVPSAAMLAGSLAKEADFFSIGTNDLTQYALAVDRNNKRVAHLYDPLNPAVLRFISMATEAAREAGLPVTVCGEVAADPLWTPLLVGLGVTELSMNAAAIPLIRRSIRLIKKEDCQRAARRALKTSSSSEVRRILSRFEQMIATQVRFTPEIHQQGA